jgi:hypothetical protein
MNISEARMKQFHRFSIFLAVFLLFTPVVPAVSAFSVSSVTISPPGSQVAGTPMTVIFVIDFPRGGNMSFPTSSELQMRTDLTDAYWVPVLVLDGDDSRLVIQSGESLVVSGWYLSYPSYQDVHLKVTVTGKVPENPSIRQDLLKIDEVDSTKNSISTAHIAMPDAPMVSLFTNTTPSTPSTPSAPSTATKKTTTKRTFTPIPTDTTPASPAGTGAGIIAIIGAALLVMRRR